MWMVSEVNNHCTIFFFEISIYFTAKLIKNKQKNHPEGWDKILKCKKLPAVGTEVEKKKG